MYNPNRAEVGFLKHITLAGDLNEFAAGEESQNGVVDPAGWLQGKSVEGERAR